MGKRGRGEPGSGRRQGNWCEREMSPPAPAGAGSAESRWGRGTASSRQTAGMWGGQGTLAQRETERLRRTCQALGVRPGAPWGGAALPWVGLVGQRSVLQAGLRLGLDELLSGSWFPPLLWDKLHWRRHVPS